MAEKFKEWKSKKDFFDMAQEDLFLDEYLTEKLWKLVKGERVSIDVDTKDPSTGDGVLIIKMEVKET